MLVTIYKKLNRAYVARFLPRGVVFYQQLFNARCARQNTQYGFTLLELLVVVTLLGIVVGAAVLALDDVEGTSAIQIAQAEMVEIGKAIQQYKHDNLEYPPQPVTPDHVVNHPADFSALFSCPYDDGVPPEEPECSYNPDAGRGWRGPYLTKQGLGFVDFVGFANVVDGAKVEAKSDAFKQYYNDASKVSWHACSDYTLCEEMDHYGSPYLLLELTGDHPRIVSMGADGRYGGVASNPCVPNTADESGKDDLVLCLK